MPYKKRYRRRRYQRPISYRQIGQKVWRDVKYLKSIVNVERKYLDTNASPDPSNTATITLLNGMAPGTTAITRNGQKIKCSSFTFNAFTTIASAAQATMVRAMIVIDHQPNAAAFAATDLLATSSVTGVRNVSNGKRFTVIMDKRISLSVNGPSQYHITKFQKLNFHTEYNTGTAGTIADITRNALFLFLISSEATNTPDFSYSFRLRFIDN